MKSPTSICGKCYIYNGNMLQYLDMAIDDIKNNKYNHSAACACKGANLHNLVIHIQNRYGASCYIKS